MDNRPPMSWTDGERIFWRAKRPTQSGAYFLLTRLAAHHPWPASVERLAHEFELRDELDGAWAVRPIELVRENGHTVLVLEDPGGEPLAQLLGAPMQLDQFFHYAVGIASVLSQLHQKGFVHKDLKPAHILVNCADAQARLTGFGLASRLPRERQAPESPETIAGTLAYMAPEQTGRMNRSIDSRSDLYSLGVTLYQMLTGALPFTAADPMEWVHCHIARKPVPPNERVGRVPTVISRIVMKLLAKTAEERYQTASGVEHDLRLCFAHWQRRQTIGTFPLGQRDASDRLLIPEKLYGRESGVNKLVAAFDRIVKSGKPELVLISGYSGIGKSSVVNELHKLLVPPRGTFASGKFDQYKRDIPYATLVEAFKSLVRPLIGKPDAELAHWRAALLDALDANAALMTELIPELKLVIGEPPAVPELEPQQAQRRFMLVFQRFLAVFAQKDHPLALFVDDLQWLDAATLDLLEVLLVHSDLRHLMLIGAYRDNEVNTRHPLTGKLLAIRNAGVSINEIRLAPLDLSHVRQMIHESLHCEPERVQPLARLVHDKTGGNPFFVIQFLQTLVEGDLLTFDHASGQWRWDIDLIHAEGYTDNVVDLMIGKLSRLPPGTQNALQQLACLGSTANINTLATVLEMSAEQVHKALWDACHQGLVEQLKSAYRFGHDRIHEAAYSLIPEAARADAHLRIGRLLAAGTTPDKHEEAIFEIVAQLNRGAALMSSRSEREQLAELNLLAGQRARASTAYASALTYLEKCAELLADNSWHRHHQLTFDLELNRAACEFLTGQSSRAEKRLTALSTRAKTTSQKASVACLHTDVCTTLDMSSRAVSVCLDYLSHVGIDWAPHPSDAEVRREYELIKLHLGARSIEELIDLPVMEDTESLATAEVLTKLFAPALQTDGNLVALMSCKAINLSIDRGNCDASCFAYVLLSRVAGPRFGDYRFGFRFGQLGYDLVEQRGLKRFEAKTYLCFSIFSVRWMKPVQACHDLLRRAFAAANRLGDIPYAAYACNSMNSDLLFAGASLAEAQAEAERGLAYVQRMHFGLVIDFISTQIAIIRTLRGLTSTFGCFDHALFDEPQIERRLSDNPALAVTACCYWIRKLQARYLASAYTEALDAAAKAQPLLWTSSSFYEECDYHFYTALALAATSGAATPANRPEQLAAMKGHLRQIKIWAGNCPENFADRAELLSAEIFRIEGRENEAARCYEQAIRAAQASGFLHNEALANELASHFYSSRGLAKIGRLYMRDARYSYQQWGADGKVRQLERTHSYLRTSDPGSDAIRTIATPVEQLDLATVLKVSQAVSSDLVSEKLIDMIMHTAMEQAGAERGVLVLSHDEELRLSAEFKIDSDTMRLHLRDAPVSTTLLPEAVLYHAIRSRETVIVDDAVTDSRFNADPYVRQFRARSILCLPLVSQAKLIGALYLENNLTACVFSPTRIAVLKLLASQAAIALENARLYRELAEREAKIRRLVDANIIGIIVWNAEGVILEANDAFLRMVGYERDDFGPDGVRWHDLTPQEWRPVSLEALEQTAQTGKAQPYEMEYLRKDGSRVPVIVGLATFEASRREGVAFVLDLTERKLAEEEVRLSEQRYREAQSELAHANRVATIGQLAASIAHEVSQPISAAVMNARVGLRWLRAEPLQVVEIRQALDRVVSDGDRALGVVSRIRQLIKKAPPRKELVDINSTIREVVELTRSEASRCGASVESQLSEGLPPVAGDHIQLQQVLLNLVLNSLEAMTGVNDGRRHLTISSEPAPAEPNSIIVTVRDTGPGFAPDSAKLLFSPFYTTKQSGLGMGLSICSSIVRSFGGQMWASTIAPHGAVIQFTLPAVPSVWPEATQEESDD